MTVVLGWSGPIHQMNSIHVFHPTRPSYRFHDDAVWGSTRKHEAKVSCCSHQSSFILKWKKNICKNHMSIWCLTQAHLDMFLKWEQWVKAVDQVELRLHLQEDAARRGKALCLFFTVHFTTLLSAANPCSAAKPKVPQDHDCSKQSGKKFHFSLIKS